MRVVLDTNVIISGLNFPGNERMVLELALRGRFELFLSWFILGEVSGVLTRKFDWDQERAVRAISVLQDAATIVEPPRMAEVIERGHPDNRILECAVAANADYLVAANRRHLLPLEEHQGASIVNSPRFLSGLDKVREDSNSAKPTQLPPIQPPHPALRAMLIAWAILAAAFLACDPAAAPEGLPSGPTPTLEAEPPQTPERETKSTTTPTPQPAEQVIPSPTPTAAVTPAPTVRAPDHPRESRETATPPAPTRQAGVTPETEAPVESDTRYVQISAGATHTCGLRMDGTIICWGEGDIYGSTGLLDSPPGSFTQIDTGYFHSCAVRKDGMVECWGGSYSDDDPLLSPAERAIMKTLLGPPDGRFISVSVGIFLNCGVKADNRAECWGAGPARSDELNPPDGKYTSVSVGDFHACGIRTDQTVACWGGNEGFHGDFLGQTTPPDGPFEVINAETYHTCGFRPDGEIRCWGSIVGGADGEVQVCEQQPDGSNECRVDEEVTAAYRAWGGLPGDVPDGDLKAIDGDQDSSCALWDGGHIRCWGYGGINEAPPPGIFTAVTVGLEHGCGLRPDGSVECWGDDSLGQASPP